MKATKSSSPSQATNSSDSRDTGDILVEPDRQSDTIARSVESSFYQYPAMMVPACQRDAIAEILKKNPTIAVIADPFVGAGTIMVQTMLAGRAFVGQDINPLAILVAKARSMCLDEDRLQTAVSGVLKQVACDRSIKYARRFFNQNKWFSRGANIALSRIYRAISSNKEYRCRVFLWACLAETVRNTSNSRTSTFKLHIRPESERVVSTQDVVTAFQKITGENLTKVTTFATALGERGLLTTEKTYRHSIVLRYGDSSVSLPANPASRIQQYDMVVTSPPYGDNRTTVTYGQAAWLPLQWVDLKDIGGEIPESAVSSMYYTDNKSLGGLHRAGTEQLLDKIAKSGFAARSAIARLRMTEGDGLVRFARFVYDLTEAIDKIAYLCHDDSWLVWTLGHRTISGVECPLTDIVEQAFAVYGIKAIARTKRKIVSKRVAYKTNRGKTMAEEYILVLKASRRQNSGRSSTLGINSTRICSIPVGPAIAA